jgi:hypothetical protein
MTIECGGLHSCGDSYAMTYADHGDTEYTETNTEKPIGASLPVGNH